MKTIRELSAWLLSSATICAPVALIMSFPPSVQDTSDPTVAVDRTVDDSIISGMVELHPQAWLCTEDLLPFSPNLDQYRCVNAARDSLLERMPTINAMPISDE